MQNTRKPAEKLLGEGESGVAASPDRATRSSCEKGEGGDGAGSGPAAGVGAGGGGGAGGGSGAGTASPGRS